MQGSRYRRDGLILRVLHKLFYYIRLTSFSVSTMKFRSSFNIVICRPYIVLIYPGISFFCSLKRTVVDLKTLIGFGISNIFISFSSDWKITFWPSYDPPILYWPGPGIGRTFILGHFSDELLNGFAWVYIFYSSLE